ncbi:LysM peptidoglycan-binding domain-containing protein [Virgibacillus sp. DJP39]|uniref:LysM peptidoglycan-binding domain-containing protein n=1 Tax=Virgibacillus sp. DJP39 TaxID=3409790 RepID=UPI003BB7E7CD
MANKKLIMSVTASAVIASTFAATKAEAASYTVKDGDTLWGIAQQYDTSVAQLKSINSLSSNIIYPSQMIETEKESTSNSNSVTSDDQYTVQSGDSLSGIADKHNILLSNLMEWNNLDTYLIHPGRVLVVSQGSSDSTLASTQETTTDAERDYYYTVQAGDTLYEIAAQKNVSVSALKEWNGLTSSLILVGQKLKTGEQAPVAEEVETPPKATNVNYNVDQLINVAKDMLGVNYAWGGTTPAGFDCSGFIYYAYKQAGMDIARTSSAGYFDQSHYVEDSQVGDLVFFEDTYKSGISHMGIYIGNGQFIHAGSDGVEIDDVNGIYYWGKHFNGYKRFY